MLGLEVLGGVFLMGWFGDLRGFEYVWVVVFARWGLFYGFSVLMVQ